MRVLYAEAVATVQRQRLSPRPRTRTGSGAASPPAGGRPTPTPASAAPAAEPDAALLQTYGEVVAHCSRRGQSEPLLGAAAARVQAQPRSRAALCDLLTLAQVHGGIGPQGAAEAGAAPATEATEAALRAHFDARSFALQRSRAEMARMGAAPPAAGEQPRSQCETLRRLAQATAVALDAEMVLARMGVDAGVDTDTGASAGRDYRNEVSEATDDV
eukprot:g4975.t1